MNMGKITSSVKYKKVEIGMKPKQVAEILTSEDVENEIVLLESGRTSKGYEFNTVTIYSKRR